MGDVVRRRPPRRSPLVAMLAAVPAAAADRPRIASLNVCTDQLLLALADPAQIVGLSPYSRDAVRSGIATDARHYPRLSGTAEDVLVLKPDLVVAGMFTRRSTRELLKDKGVRVIEFDVVGSLDEAKAQMGRMGDVAGHPERAAAQIARLDSARRARAGSRLAHALPCPSAVATRMGGRR